MSSVQIRELPDDLYQRLALRAQREHRSLAQQALCDLQTAAGAGARARRTELLERIRREASDPPAIEPPEALIREDRSR